MVASCSNLGVTNPRNGGIPVLKIGSQDRCRSIGSKRSRRNPNKGLGLNQGIRLAIPVRRHHQHSMASMVFSGDSRLQLTSSDACLILLPPFLFRTNRSNAKGIETPLMPPVTTIEHHLSGHLPPSITTAPCQIVIGHTTTAKSEARNFIYFLTTTQAMVFVSDKGSNSYISHVVVVSNDGYSTGAAYMVGSDGA
uniref:Uncharacterized protein n=1 Tax=Helianthus annuus TaxID=4232 RepID=A0A251TBZ9_HELAN